MVVISSMRSRSRKGMSKIMFIIVMMLLVTFLGGIVLTFVGDFVQAAVGSGSALSIVSDLIGGL